MIHGGFILQNKLCRSKDYKDCIKGILLTEMHKTLRIRYSTYLSFLQINICTAQFSRGIFLVVKAIMDPLCPWGSKDSHDLVTKQTFTQYFYVPDTVLRAS